MCYFSADEKPLTALPGIGRYVRVASSARIDVIGRVVGYSENRRFVAVRVENWTADGLADTWSARPEELTRSTAAEARKAARLR